MNTRGFFFYSAKQKAIIADSWKPDEPVFCRLKDGRVVEYTEWCETDKPFGKWDDYVFLGEGEYIEGFELSLAKAAAAHHALTGE